MRRFSSVLFAAALVVTVASGCGDRGPERETGSVRIVQHARPGAFPNGAIWHLTIDGPGGFRGSFPGGVRDVTLRVPAGVERFYATSGDVGYNLLRSFDRPCAVDSKCAQLAPATKGCRMTIHALPGKTVEYEVVVNRDQTCFVRRLKR